MTNVQSFVSVLDTLAFLSADNVDGINISYLEAAASFPRTPIYKFTGHIPKGLQFSSWLSPLTTLLWRFQVIVGSLEMTFPLVVIQATCRVFLYTSLYKRGVGAQTLKWDIQHEEAAVGKGHCSGPNCDKRKGICFIDWQVPSCSKKNVPDPQQH